MPDRVKCLHSLYGHHLATRDNPIGEWVAEQDRADGVPAPCVTADADMSRRAGGRLMRVAAVDVGTNSVRLSGGRAPGDPLHQVEREMRITRLGKGVDATGHLDDESLDRTLATIADYAALGGPRRGAGADRRDERGPGRE
jgi:exopolyphosphatase / guanosine-5'-triphosphate,3'-diphosphate pyrophosphatase